MFHKEIKGLVSIIIPIYNVEKYLDRCLETVVEQTYTNIQIILINDGSTDDSELCCLKWEKKDSRIIFVSKKNEKQGPTRNLGVQIANGEYIMFVDPDDYVEKTYVEEMFSSISKYNADMAVCDIYRIKNGKKNELLSNYDILETDSYCNNHMLLYTMSGALWAKIYRRSLFIENDIIQSKYNGQDSEVFPQILISAKKVSQVKKALYNYVIDRAGNATTVGINQVKGIAPIVENVVNYFKKRGIFDEIKEDLNKFLTRLYIYAFYNNSSKKEFRACVTEELHNETVLVMQQYFEDWSEKKPQKIIQIGNPSTRSYIMKINPFSSFFSEECLDRYQFSSIISIMSNEAESNISIFKKMIEVKDNPFREEMLKKDINKAFTKIKQSEWEKKDYILIDFLEERYDIIEYKGNYYTKNNLINYDKFMNREDYKVLKRNSKELSKIWKEKCLDFINILKIHFEKDKIYLVEKYVNKHMRDYECSCEEEEINKILKDYYTFFKENYEEIHVWKG